METYTLRNTKTGKIHTQTVHDNQALRLNAAEFADYQIFNQQGQLLNATQEMHGDEIWLYFNQVDGLPEVILQHTPMAEMPLLPTNSMAATEPVMAVAQPVASETVTAQMVSAGTSSKWLGVGLGVLALGGLAAAAGGSGGGDSDDKPQTPTTPTTPNKPTAPVTPSNPTQPIDVKGIRITAVDDDNTITQNELHASNGAEKLGLTGKLDLSKTIFAQY